MMQVKQRDIRRALIVLGRCAEKRATIPIMSAVKATANGALTLEASDLDMVMQVHVPWGGATPKRESAFLIEDFRFVGQAIGAAGGDMVDIEQSDTGMTFAAGAMALAQESACDVADFPTDTITPTESWLKATLSPAHLALIERLKPAISTEETRYYLNGVFLHRTGDWTWRAAATDGHKLIYADLVLPDATGAAADVILPRKAINLAVELLKGSCDGVALTIGAVPPRNQEDSTAPERRGAPRVLMEGVHAGLALQLATKVIDGTYPDYARVIPREDGIAHRALTRVSTLRQGLNAVALAFSRTPCIRMSFEADAIVLEAASAPKGLSLTYRVAAQHDMPANFAIGFNGQYLLAMLASLRGEDVVIGLNDAAGPVALRDPAEAGFGAILMPVRL
jgi:DNA polymerase-3 subunit beta